MTKLWIKFRDHRATQVSTKGCQDVYDFLKACKKALQLPNPPQELSLSTTDGGSDLKPGLRLTDVSSQPGYLENSDDHPLFISVEEQTLNEIATGRSDAAVSAFWNAFKYCSDPIQENTVIQLPQDVFMLGNPIIGSSIFIRPCYPKLLEMVFSILKDHASPHLVILGTPGIGKTFFGYVLLLHLARTGATVVYERGRENARYLFSEFGIFTGNRNDFTNYLRRISTFYIVDDAKPVDVAARTVLLSSLGHDFWYSFSKEKCAIRYMPICSWEEIEICRGLLFGHLTSAETKSLYNKWGGVPRHVLLNARDISQQKLLLEALDFSNLNCILEFLRGNSKKEYVLGHLIHRSVGPNFGRGPFQFASEYVAQEIYKFVVIDRDHFFRFISSYICQISETLFEQHAHTLISNGGSFKIRNLKTNEESRLQLPIDLNLHLYSSNDLEFQSATNKYFRPVNKIFKSVDSFIKPNLLFEMTISKDHQCSYTGLCDVLETLGNPLNPELYFVVPDRIFSSFTYQNYLEKEGDVLSGKGIVGSIQKLSQFVLTFELPSK